MERLRKAIGDSGLDGVLIVPGPNMRYFTGVNSLMLERPFLLFVPRDGEARLVAPVIEAGPYKDCQLPMSVHSWTDSQGPGRAMKEAAKTLRKGKWGVEGRVPFLYLSALRKQMQISLEDAEPILQGLRAIKDADEVLLLKKSSRILSKSFEECPALVEEGMTELELASKLTNLIRGNGAITSSDLLVQSGARAADPHSIASKKKIRSGEPVILDLVSSFEGYHSDITRTLCVGNSAPLERLYERVLEAQLQAISSAAEGVRVGDVDRAARSLLEKYGLGKYFTHRTGHGLGLEVHEAPYIVEGGVEKLKENMFFTVEPGAYLPGKRGVRIEDNIRIAGGRAVEITDPPKEYGWWR